MRDDPDQPEVELEFHEEFYPNGTPWKRWHTANGEMHGLFESFHHNGVRSEQGEYEHGAKTGLWLGWDDTGRKMFEGIPNQTSDFIEPDDSAWNEEITVTLESKATFPVRLWIEFGVVMALAWLYPFVTGVIGFANAVDYNAAFEEVGISELEAYESAVGEIVASDKEVFNEMLYSGIASIQVFIPLLWLMWQSKLSWHDSFVAKPRIIRDVLLGVVVAVVMILFDELVMQLTNPYVYGYPSAEPASGLGWTWIALAMLLNSLAEEFVWRGFMLGLLKKMTGSMTMAVIISTALFASYHIYQGPVAVLLVAVSGFGWCLLTIATKSLWPAVISHTAFNIAVYALPNVFDSGV